MKHNFNVFTRISLAFISTALALGSLISCGEDSGLGATIDTEAPKMAISYPNPKANNVAMGEFVLAGTCSDDKIVSRVEVAVTNLDSQKSYGSFPATVNAQANTWSITFNTFDDSNGDNYNGYPFPDGSYQFVATAYDNVGHSTQDTSTLEIDNTAPVFVISKPGVVISDTKEESTKISKYGSVFSIEGTVAERHQVSKMDLQIYDESGNLVNTEPYEENEISTTGGTSVTIARFLEGGSEETNIRYNDIYGTAGSVADSDGNKRYSCTVTLSDNAKVFRHPGDDGVEKGNESSVVYLNDDIYDKYMSSRKGAGLSADDFRKVINKTATESDITGKGQAPVTLDDVASALKELAVDTSLQSGDNPLDTTLSFSINPNADPTYLVSGFNFKYTDSGDGVADSVKTATQNQGITVAVSCSLDGVKIKPSAFKVWMKDIGNSDDGVSSEEKVRDEIATLVDQVKIEEENAAKEERSFDESVVSNGWLLLHDNSSDKAPSDTSVNINEDLPNTIEFNHYYIIAVTGKDTDDVYLSQSKLYGFVGNVSGTPPTISVTSPEKTSPAEDPYVKSSDFAFEGTAEATTAGTNVKSLSLTLTVNDEGEGKGNAEIASISASIDYDKKTNQWSSSDGFSCDYDGKLCQWTFNPSLHHEYEKIKAEEGAEKAYSYSISVTATSSTGLTATKDWNVHVDTVKPVVSLNSATPVVIGKDYYDDSDENYYLNGEIKVSANAGDNAKLAKVSYDVWANCDLSKELTKDDSILDVLKSLAPDKVDGSLGTQSIISETFDTALITKYFESQLNGQKDPAIQILMTITAEDMAGNTQTSSTKTIYDKFVIKQETDRPLVHFGNADPEITSSADLSQDVNVFGTNSNNKLTLTLSDDDKINSYEITLYEADGETLADTGDIANPLTKAVGQTTASISYRLPEKEGEYQFKIIVRDFMPPSELSPDADEKHPYGKSEIGPFFIAVDAGAPEFKITKPQGKIEVKDAFAVSGIVVEGSGSVTMSVTGWGTSTGYSSAKEISETAGDGKTFSDTISLPKKDGVYTITYTARDKYGYYTPQTISYNVDTTKPTIESSSVSANGILLSDGNFNSNYPLDIVVKASDETEDYAGTITEVAYSAYSGKVTETAGTPVIPWTPLTYKNEVYTASASGFINANGGNGISDGEYTVFIRATDSVGNESALMPIRLVADKTKPVLTTSSDPGSMSVDGSYFEKGEFTIEGELEEANLAEFYYSLNDGEKVSIPLDQNGNWSIASGEIPEEGGTFAYIITAKDKAGSVTTLKRTVTIDKKAPRITIDDWKNSTTVVNYKNSETVTFSGTVKDEENGSGLAEVKVWYENASDKKFAEETVTANTSGEWTHTFTGIPEGSYTLHVLAKDNAGNEFEESKNFGIDLTKPASTLGITGSIFDNSNGAAEKLSENDFSGKWNNDITYLSKENFTLSGTISDVAFRAKNIRLSVKKDGGAESTAVLVLKKADGTEFNGESELKEEITSLSWSYEQNLKEDHSSDGVYTYKLSATDDAGNSAEYTFIVRVDTTAPTVTVTSPTSGQNFKYEGTTGKANVTISGTAFDSGAGAYKVYYDITKDGESLLKVNSEDADEVASFTNENWTNAKEILLSEQGNLTLQVTAEDYLGNKASRTVDFVCDSLPPVISGEKVNGETVKTTYYNSGLIELSVSAVDAVSGIGSVKYKLNDGVERTMSLSNGVYGASVICEEGENKIVISASDTHDNTTSTEECKEITVKVDSTAPVFSDTKVSASASKENVTISGKLSENIALAQTDGLTVSATRNGNPVSQADLASAIAAFPTLDSGKPLTDAQWTFTLKADSENHSADGKWVFTITAKDVAGNTSVSTASVLIDTVAPTLSNIEAKASDGKSSTVVGKTYFNGSKALELTIDASDNEGIGLYNVEYNIVSGHEEAWKNTLETKNETWISLSKNGLSDSWKATIVSDFANLADGDYTIFVHATDQLGNETYSEGLKLVNDKTSPVLKTTNDPTNMTGTENDGSYFKNGEFSIEGTLAETNLASLTYTLNGEEAKTLPLNDSNWSIASGEIPEEGGTFAYSITAKDEAGNEALLTRTVKIDNKKPTLTIETLNEKNLSEVITTKNTTCTFKGSISDAGGSGLKPLVAYYTTETDTATKIKSSEFSSNQNSWEVSFDSVEEDKSFILTVEAEDNAGNKETITKKFGVDCKAPSSTLKVTDTVLDKSAGTPTALSSTADHNDKWNRGTTFIAKENFTLSGTVSDVFPFRGKNIKLTRTKAGGTEETLITSTDDAEISSLDWSYEQEVKDDHSADGVYTYKLSTQDEAGNIASYSFIVQVDTSAPTLTIVKPASGANFKPASGSTATVTIEGTAFDDGAGAYQVIYNVKKGETVVKADTPATLKSGKWDSELKLSDSHQGHLILTVTVTDYLGNSEASTVSFFCDSIAPTLSNGKVDDATVKNTFYNSTLLNISADATDAISGVGNLTYKLEDGAEKAMLYSEGSTDAGETATYAASVNCKEGDNSIVIYATDTNGNKTTESASIAFTVKVDATAPALTAGSVKIGTSAGNASATENFYYNGKQNMYISGAVTDALSGVKEVYVLPYSKITDTTATEENKAVYEPASEGATGGTFSISISKDSLKQSGTIYARIVDNAGNINDLSLIAFTYDGTAPAIPNASLSGNAVSGTLTTAAYKSGKDTAGNDKYFVNTNSGNSFTFSGVATDNLALAKLELSIDGGVGSIDPITEADELSEWSFTGITLTSESKNATFTLTDKAGNTATKTIALVCDVTAPQSQHDKDALGKEYYFRVGDAANGSVTDVGSKYAAGTYGNSTTIKIRGNFAETGSGTSLIYYKLYSDDIPNAEGINEFLANPEDKKTGYFSPLTTNETKAVSLNTDSGKVNQDVVSTFKTTISGFTEGSNYLVLLAVDNVGNKALDTITCTPNGETALNCYSINVDTKAPSLTSDVTGTILTNGTGTGDAAYIAISGTATDEHSGIDTVTLSITVGTNEHNYAATVVDAPTSEDANKKAWSAKIPKSIFSSIETGNFPVYATAKDNAGEGNKQTVSVAQISVDKIAPEVTLNNPSNADTSAADGVIRINGTISLSGTVKDGNILPENNEDETSNTVTKIRYAKFDTKPDAAPANDSWKDIEVSSIKGNYTFDVAGFVTSSLDNEKYYYIQAVAVDKAGNTGYSNATLVKISQDTDRPIVKINNLTPNGTGANASYILKYGTDAQVTGTIVDDDSTNTAVVKKLFITETEYNGTGTEPTNNLATSNGDFTFQPADSVDGLKTFYIYIEDNAGGKFYTKAAAPITIGNPNTGNPKISVKGELVAESVNNKEFSYKSDSTSPVARLGEGLPYAAETSAVAKDDNGEDFALSTAEKKTDNATLNASFKVGGLARRYVKFYFTANDASGVEGMSVEFKDEKGNSIKKLATASKIGSLEFKEDDEFYVSGTFTASSDASTDATWTTGFIDFGSDFGSVATGQLSVSITPYDYAGLPGNGTYQFYVDNDAPTIKISEPESGDELTGTISISGTASDVGTAGTVNIQWIVPTDEQVTIYTNKSAEEKLEYLKGLELNGGKDAIAEKHSVSNWKFEFDNNLNPKFDVYDSSTYATNSDCDSTSIYYLPVYFLATDALGNCSAETNFFIKHNPEADKPKLEFTYPTTENYKSSTEQYAVLGGTIRATGSAVIPSGTTTVNSVYYQIATKVVTDNGDETWNDFGTADKEKAEKAISEGGYGYTVVSAYDVINELTGKNYSASTTFTDEQLKDFLKTYGFASRDVLNAWWGIKATGTASWNFKINEKGELNPDSGTTDIRLRVCGVNAEGKFGAWTNDENVIEIHVDNKAPVITYAVNQYANGSAAITALPTDDAATTEIDESKPTASKTYEAEMYLKGNWTFVATLLDETSVTSYNVKVNGSPLTENEGYFVKSDVTAEVELKDGSKNTKYGVTLFIPIPKPAANSNTDTVEITVSADDGENHTEQTFDFKIDETAPSFDKLSGNGTLIADNKLDAIEDSNYHFMLDGEAEDNGSGVKNVVFYFMRKNGTTGTIGTDVVMDPMITTGTDDSKVNMKDAQGKDALTALEYTQGNDKFYLYANLYSGSATTDTFTSGSDYDAHVRKGGLVQIDGVLRTITGKSGKTVTFTPSLTEAKENVTAYFPIAQVIDNPATEKVSSYSTNPFTFERGDDGDNMPESFSGKATKTWSAEIRSANMPDGPVSIVILAFDEAGNVAGKTINTKITNNAPRLAKVFFGTDLSGDEKFTNSSSLTEIVEYDILGAEGATQSAYTLDFTEKLKNKDGTDSDNNKYPAGVFTIKNGLAVIPELTGGNGLVGMVLSTTATTADAVTGTGENLISCDSDGTIASADGKVTGTFSGKVEGTFAGSNSSYRMHSYVVDSTKLGPDDDKGMSFTFWDSTEETTQGSTSQNAVLYVTNFKVAQGDSVPPTVVVNPFYWNSSSDNSLYANPAKNGHIELEDDLPTDTFKDNDTVEGNDVARTGLYDRDPKVSGKIRFTGTAYDNRRLSMIKIKFGDFIVEESGEEVEVASYEVKDSTAETKEMVWKLSGKTMAANGYEFKVIDTASDSIGNFGDSVYFSQKGHKVYWTLDIDTERISTKAATDVQLTVLATDAAIGDEPSGRTTSTATTGTYKIDAPVVDATTKARTVTDGTTNYPIYQMDVVPYIVGLKTSLSALKKGNSSVYDRTARGHYPVASTETIYVYGFNLDGGTLYDSATTAASASLTSVTASAQSWYSSDAAPYGSVYSVGAISAFTSGEVYVETGAENAKVKSLNNLNNNGAYGKAYTTAPTVNSTGSVYKDGKFYNRQPNGDNNNKLTDDVVLDVWEINSEAGKPKSGPLSQPVMTINPVNKQVGFAFANGPLHFSMGSLEKSYDVWEQGLDFWTSIGFAYDANGNSFGTTAGGDINGTPKADSFGFFTSRWAGKGIYNNGSGHNNGTGQLRLELVGQAESTNGSSFNGNNINKQRIKSPSIATTVTSSSATNTNVYLAYYDEINDEIRFKWGIISNSENNTTGRSQNNLLYDYYGGESPNDDTYKDTARNTKSLTASKTVSNLPYTLEYVSLIAGQTTDKKTFVPGASGTKYTANTAVMTRDNRPVCAGQYVCIAAKYQAGDTYEIGTEETPVINEETGEPVTETVSVNFTDDLVVAVWYDSTNNQLLYSYNKAPQKISAPTYGGNNYYRKNEDGTSTGIDSFSQSATGWSTPVAVFGEGNGIGEYCKVALDANGKVHIACYDNANADVWYAYIDDYTSPSNAKTCIVDSYGIVGTELYLDVALKDSNPVPYISYYGSSCARPKVAYWASETSIASATDLSGAKDEAATGNWETSIIPSTSKISIDHINVGVWKDSSGNLTYSTTDGNVPNGKQPGKTGANVGKPNAGTDNGMIYGNGTKNPILGYAITKGAGGYIETAQMK